MKGALIILGVLILLGVVVYVVDRLYYKKKEYTGKAGEKGLSPGSHGTADLQKGEDECCGMHIICEKNSLTPTDTEIVYYDDEELDCYKGRKSDTYTHEEEEAFRDVLLTLLPEDVAGWARSLQLRGIDLPVNVREELLMIVSDMRSDQK